MDWGPIVDVLQGVVLVLAAAGGVGGGGLLLHQRRQQRRDSERPPEHPQRPALQVDPLCDTGQYPALDTGQMLSPVYQARLLRQIAEQTAHLADRSNGHGAVRREELAALGIELRSDIGDLRGDIRQVTGLLGTHATAIARIQATCEARVARDCRS